MNAGFWEHLINVASHLTDAKRMGDAEREAQRQAAAADRKSRQQKQRPATTPAFSSAPAPAADGACCVAKRKFKVK